jgi:hypothetical protein
MRKPVQDPGLLTAICFQNFDDEFQNRVALGCRSKTFVNTRLPLKVPRNFTARLKVNRA